MPASAHASSPADVAVAEALFREARELVAAGKPREACPKFAESQRLDPAPGTLLNLGDCYERAGLAASAWGAYQEAASASRQAGLAGQAANADALAREIEGKVPYLVIRVGQGRDVPDLSITRDGALVPRSQWDAPIPVDPGLHEIAARAPGRAPFAARVELVASAAAQGDRRTVVDIPLLAAIAEPPRPADADASATHPRKTAAFVVGAVGLAALAAGTVVGLIALDRDAAAREAGCNDSSCWTSQGRDLTVRARDFAAASTWLFVGGGALTGTGIALLLSVPSPSPPSSQSRPQQGVSLGAHVRW